MPIYLSFGNMDSIQRDRKHCINFADNKNYLVGTVRYLETYLQTITLLMNLFKSEFFGIEIIIIYEI